MRPVVLLPLLSVAAACGTLQGPTAYCTATRPVAVRVTVLDSVSGASLADSAYGVARTGTAVDSLRLASPPPVLEGGMTLGTYEVTIDRPRYREWTRTGIIVSQQGACANPIPVAITALLQLAP